jgi:dTDP-4-dehydrorhamnose reductase
VADAARATLYLANIGREGIYHIVNAGQTTWFHFATQALQLAGLSVPIDPISTAEYGAAARRPAYSVLNTDKYLSIDGPQLPPWSMALAAYMATLATKSPAVKATEPRAA